MPDRDVCIVSFETLTVRLRSPQALLGRAGWVCWGGGRDRISGKQGSRKSGD
jgi:hypothetical protein